MRPILKMASALMGVLLLGLIVGLAWQRQSDGPPMALLNQNNAPLNDGSLRVYSPELDRQRLYLAVPETGFLRPITEITQAANLNPTSLNDDWFYAWLADDYQLFGGYQSGGIYRFKSDLSERQLIVPIVSSLVWSPDGNWCYYLKLIDPYRGEIFRVRADGSDRQNLTAKSAVQIYASPNAIGLSPDGEWLVFTHNFSVTFSGIPNPTTQDYDVYRMRVDGSDLQNLTALETEDVIFEQWPAGSDWLVVRKGPQIAMMRPDGTDLQALDLGVANIPFPQSIVSPAANLLLITVGDLPAMGFRLGEVDPIWQLEANLTSIQPTVFGDWIILQNGKRLERIRPDGTERALIAEFPDTILGVQSLDDGLLIIIGTISPSSGWPPASTATAWYFLEPDAQQLTQWPLNNFSKSVRAISPDGKYLVLSDWWGHWRLSLSDRSGNHQKVFAEGDANFFFLSWLPPITRHWSVGGLALLGLGLLVISLPNRRLRLIKAHQK